VASYLQVAGSGSITCRSLAVDRLYLSSSAAASPAPRHSTAAADVDTTAITSLNIDAR